MPRLKKKAARRKAEHREVGTSAETTAEEKRDAAEMAMATAASSRESALAGAHARLFGSVSNLRHLSSKAQGALAPYRIPANRRDRGSAPLMREDAAKGAGAKSDRNLKLSGKNLMPLWERQAGFFECLDGYKASREFPLSILGEFEYFADRAEYVVSEQVHRISANIFCALTCLQGLNKAFEALEKAHYAHKLEPGTLQQIQLTLCHIKVRASLCFLRLFKNTRDRQSAEEWIGIRRSDSYTEEEALRRVAEALFSLQTEHCLQPAVQVFKTNQASFDETYTVVIAKEVTEHLRQFYELIAARHPDADEAHHAELLKKAIQNAALNSMKQNRARLSGPLGPVFKKLTSETTKGMKALVDECEQAATAERKEDRVRATAAAAAPRPRG